ncbi:hypothetical protein CI238_11690 [Colletotrichum incanum]|uniref:Uncharacterized protein n=1 Tax=Colletotrichum incanum TaxID=1573173 RepID=A0A162NJ67_COLIC|nr:hypothetical protein CI238_11690 [Colletotrichum incanum]
MDPKPFNFHGPRARPSPGIPNKRLHLRSAGPLPSQSLPESITKKKFFKQATLIRHMQCFWNVRQHFHLESFILEQATTFVSLMPIHASPRHTTSRLLKAIVNGKQPANENNPASVPDRPQRSQLEFSTSPPRCRPNLFLPDVTPKLVYALWTSLCRAANADIHVSAAHHHQANRQAEPSVQTLTHAFRSLIGAQVDHSNWKEILPYILASLNTSISAASRQVLYEMVSADPPVPSTGHADNNLRVTVTISPTSSNKHGKLPDFLSPPDLKQDDLVYVEPAKKRQSRYHLDTQTKFSHTKHGPSRSSTSPVFSSTISSPHLGPDGIQTYRIDTSSLFAQTLSTANAKPPVPSRRVRLTH